MDLAYMCITVVQTLSLITRAWKSGFDALMLTTDTWQLAWRPTDINIANYTYVLRQKPLILSNTTENATGFTTKTRYGCPSVLVKIVGTYA